MAQEKQKTQLILAAFLVVILALLVLYNARRVKAPKGKQQQVAPVIPQEPSVNNPPTPGEVNLVLLEERAKELQWGRDPFILSLRKGEELPTLQLQVTGIIYDPIHAEETYAIINDEVVRIGDNLRGIKVVDIQPDSVRFKKFNQEFTLFLYDESKKPKGQGQKTH